MIKKDLLIILTSLFKLLRPAHYIKNLFVFLPLFFSAQFYDTLLLFNVSAAFISFCLISSSVYIFNDIWDINEDRIHPANKTRPIASGIVSIKLAYFLDAGLSIFALLFSYIVNQDLLFVILAYKILNIFYTLGLKKIAVLDIFVLSLGFILRLYAGSVSTNIELTVWIIILTFLLSMLLALGKRRNDVLFFEKEGVVLRNAIKGYNLVFLNYSMIIISSVIIVAYILYTVSPETTVRVGSNQLFITSFWVLAGIMRYLQLLFVFNRNENPVSLLLKDNSLKLILLGWIFNFLFFLYLS